MSKESALQFDKLGALYEDMALWPFRRYIETPSVQLALGSLDGLDVVDYGCGSGYYSRLLKTGGAKQVVGYDLAEGMLDYARRCAQRDGLDIEFRSSLGDACSGRFDLVLAVYVLPYATTQQELEQMTMEMMGPLRPGGRLVALPIHQRYAPETSYYQGCGFTLTPEDSGIPYDEGGGCAWTCAIGSTRRACMHGIGPRRRSMPRWRRQARRRSSGTTPRLPMTTMLPKSCPLWRHTPPGRTLPSSSAGSSEPTPGMSCRW